MVMSTYSLAQQLEGTGVSVTCMNPGKVRSRLKNRSTVQSDWSVGLFFNLWVLILNLLILILFLSASCTVYVKKFAITWTQFEVKEQTNDALSRLLNFQRDLWVLFPINKHPLLLWNIFFIHFTWKQINKITSNRKRIVLHKIKCFHSNPQCCSTPIFLQRMILVTKDYLQNINFNFALFYPVFLTLYQIGVKISYLKNIQPCKWSI